MFWSYGKGAELKGYPARRGPSCSFFVLKISPLIYHRRGGKTMAIGGGDGVLRFRWRCHRLLPGTLSGCGVSARRPEGAQENSRRHRLRMKARNPFDPDRATSPAAYPAACVGRGLRFLRMAACGPDKSVPFHRSANNHDKKIRLTWALGSG